MSAPSITRIVKMEFKHEEVHTFTDHFQVIKDKIRSFPGCISVDLLQDITNDNIFFTYSHWESAEDLETYRHSSLFRETWSFVKPLFEQKAQAWSVYNIDSV